LDSTGIFRDAIIAILAAIAKQERTRRSERAAAAVARLRRQGKTDHLGRNRLLVGHKLEQIRQLHAEGLSLRAIGKQLHVSPMTVMRALERAA
jgi:DNA invertase Pin-like site-specific DNA recombinase